MTFDELVEKMQKEQEDNPELDIGKFDVVTRDSLVADNVVIIERMKVVVIS